MRTMRRLAVIILAAIALAACSSNGETSSGKQLDTLHRDSFEAIVGTWPLTVDEATPVCGETPGAIGIQVDGTTYALNGTASTHEHWPTLDPIWADNPKNPGTKLPDGDLINYITQRC